MISLEEWVRTPAHEIPEELTVDDCEQPLRHILTLRNTIEFFLERVRVVNSKTSVAILLTEELDVLLETLREDDEAFRKHYNV